MSELDAAGDDRAVTTAQLAELIGCHPETLYRYTRTPEAAGGIPRLRLGPQLRFDVDAVLAWMREQAGVGSAENAGGPAALQRPGPGTGGESHA